MDIVTTMNMNSTSNNTSINIPIDDIIKNLEKIGFVVIDKSEYSPPKKDTNNMTLLEELSYRYFLLTGKEKVLPGLKRDKNGVTAYFGDFSYSEVVEEQALRGLLSLMKMIK